MGKRTSVSKRLVACRVVVAAAKQGQAPQVASRVAEGSTDTFHDDPAICECTMSVFIERLKGFIEHFHRRPPRSTHLGKHLHLELKKKDTDLAVIELCQGMAKRFCPDLR